MYRVVFNNSCKNIAQVIFIIAKLRAYPQKEKITGILLVSENKNVSNWKCQMLYYVTLSAFYGEEDFTTNSQKSVL